MVKWYYTVIVGTQPGVYADWTQVAPKVSEISGAIHKKFKTRAEALEAFNRATREGTVRVVPVDQELDAASLASSRSSSPLPVARDNYQRLRPRHHTQERQFRRAASHGHAIARPPPRPAPRLGRSFRSNPRPSATTSNILSPTHAGPSNLADTTRRVSVGAEPREHEQSDQGSRTRPDYVYRTQPSSSPSSRFADYIRAPSPVGPHNRGNERWWEIHQRSVGALPSSFGVDDRISIPRGQASPSSHSTYRLSRSPQLEANQDIGSQVYASGSQSFGVDLVVSPRSHGEGDYKGKRRASIQSEDSCLVSFDWPRDHGEASTLQTRVEPDNSLSSPVLPRPPSACSHISLASSIETSRSGFSFDVNIAAVKTPESLGRSAHVGNSAPHSTVSLLAVLGSTEDEIPGQSMHIQESLSDEGNGDDPLLTTRGLRVSSDPGRFFGNLSDAASPLEHTYSPEVDSSYALDDGLHLSQLSPLPIDISPSSRRSAWSLRSPLLWPHVDLETSHSAEVTGLGLSIEGAVLPSSPCYHPLSHRTTTPASPGRPPSQRAASIAGKSVRGSDTPPQDVPASRGQASLRDPESATCERTQGEGPRTESTNGAVPSPRNVPLPSSPSASPTTSTPGSSGHLQAQPSHRTTPNMPFYPSLADGDEDRVPLSPSGYRVPLGLPTPELSPMQVPAMTRSSSFSSDPRSPIAMWTRIPNSIMGLSRFFGRPTPPGNDTRMDP